MTDLEEPDQLQELPPSSKLVYKVLEYEGPMSINRLSKHTWLSKTTLYDAVGRLEDQGLVETKPLYIDPRQTVCRLKDSE